MCNKSSYGQTYIRGTRKTSTLNLIRHIRQSTNHWAILDHWAVLALVTRFGVYGTLVKFPETLDYAFILSSLDYCRVDLAVTRLKSLRPTQREVAPMSS